MVDSLSSEKVLIYTLRTDIADQLSDAVYHSKSKEEDVLEHFKESDSGHCAVVNSVQAGITIKRLNKVIFHTFTSNTESLQQRIGRSLLYEFHGELSEIHLFYLKDTQMEIWLAEAISSMDPRKVYYVLKDKTYNRLEWIRMNNPGKDLYLYEGSVVFKSLEDNMYHFLSSPSKGYFLSQSKLTKIE